MRILEGGLGDLAVKDGEVLSKPVEFPHMPFDCAPFIFGQRLAGQPVSAPPIKQIGVRTLRDKVRMQDRMHFILDPRAMTDDLITTRRKATLTFGSSVRCPYLGQEAGRVQACQRAGLPTCRLANVQACQRAGVDFVGLHLSVGNRLHLQRIGDDHPSHER